MVTMHIDPKWRVLTIGDGDLSFSLALMRHHKLQRLVATTLDSEADIREKYQSHGLDALSETNAEVYCGVDVTDPNTWPNELNRQFDLVLFQFPLIPAVGSRQEFESGLSVNTRNRRLLHLYLKHCGQYFLDQHGAGLACISSKDVKPYIQWNIETALHQHTEMTYLGKRAFDISAFPGYRIRNVDRDKHVKTTKAFSYYWRHARSSPLAALDLEPYQPLSGDHCPLCDAGPFTTKQEKQGHLDSKKHKNMVKFVQDWQDYLRSHYNDNDKRLL